MVILEKTAVPTAIVLFFIALTLGGIMTFLPIYARSLGITDIGLFFMVYAGALLLSRFKMGRLADQYGVTIVVLPGLLIVVISLTILSLATTLTTFLVVAALYGFGLGSVFPTLNAIMVKLCPEERRGAGNATYFSAMDIGVGLGSVIWGVVSEKMGFFYVYLGCALCAILSMVLYIFILRKQLLQNTGTRVGLLN